MHTRRLLLILATFAPLLTRAELPLVPLPAELTVGEGHYRFRPGDHAVQRISPELAAAHGLESYHIRVAAEGVTIEAGGPAGQFYARQTLAQLQQGDQLPAVDILDYPRFAWRGFMLDVARHFASVEKVKQLLDAMAFYKLNTFHWHLSDDQGWRIEIPAYPELTRKGAWRGAGEAVPAYKEDASDARYGGFYTQAEVADIVRYAAARHITIVPEIDVPGHSRAAAAAYPEILCLTSNDSKSVQGESGNVWCVGRAENYEMLDAIVAELRWQFPGPFLHVGGDEVNRNAWKDCPRCQARLAAQGLKDVGQLQNDFIQHMEQITRKHGFSMLGWNEILHGGKLDPSTTIMAWTGADAGHEAAARGHRVVMAPGPHCYLDMKENAQDPFGHWWAGVVSLSKVYAFDPLAGGGVEDERPARILGVQGALWAEFITEPARMDQKIWPRLCALAEVAWTPQARRDFTRFMARLGPAHFQQLAKRGLGYRMPEAAARVEAGRVVIDPPFPGADVRYTLDGSEPAADGLRWDGAPLEVAKVGQLRTRVFGPGGRSSLVMKGAGRPPAKRDGALTPAAQVATTMPVYAEHQPAQAVDWNAKTFFWSSAKGRRGETFTITFDAPQALKSVEVPTGKLDDSTADLVVDGQLEASADGVAFERVAGFEYGTARAELGGRTVKALRVVLNADHDTWIVVQDPILR